MNLDLTEFQQLLQRTARDFVAGEYPLARHRELMDAGTPFDDALWQKAAGLGWPGLIVPEQYGGAGAGWADAVVLLEELGRGLLPTALLAHYLAAAAIAAIADEAQRVALLPLLAAGRRVAAVALTGARDGSGALALTCAASLGPPGYRLEGTLPYVRGAQAADLLLVPAKVGDLAGIFVVELRAPGVVVEPLVNTGGDDVARVALAVDCAPAALLGGTTTAASILESLACLGTLMECAYGVGVMSRDTELTIEYVKERVQFGRPIGAFQAVKHQVADQVTDVDCGRLLTQYAAWAVDRGDAGAPAAIARAKAWVSDALRRVTRTGNQLHGGIGFALEYDIHYFFERAKNAELMFGAAAEHRERVASALLDG